MAKACEECTHNCLMMHNKKSKNPASLVTTFVKFMIGDDYSKRLFLPPNFSCRAKKLVGKTTRLEDLNGEKWDVTCTKIDDRLAFEQGWNPFALKHGLQKGDVLVFHYIMKSHFVVLMYGSTGCPEIRHFGFPHLLTKETKKGNNNLTVNGQISSKVHASCNESSSKSESVGHRMNDMKTMSKKLNEAKMLSPNENATNPQHLVASSSRPEDNKRDQSSELLVNNAFLDYIFSESLTAVKPLCLVDNDNRHEKDERGSNSLQPVVLSLHGGQKNNVAASDGGSDETEINRIQKSVETDGGQNVATSGGGPDETEIMRNQKSVEPDGGQKNNVVASGGGLDETEVNRTRKLVELGSGQKNNVDASGGGSDETERKRLLRKSLDAKIAISTAKRKGSAMIQNEIAHDNSTHKRLRPADVPITPAKNVKQEPDTSRLHNSGYPLTPKPTAKQMEPTKKEPTMNNGSVGPMKKEPKTNHGSDDLIKREPKPEPVDYDEEPLSGPPSNASFSATMSSYQYLELPSWVKVKGMVILLRNGSDLWPVRFQKKFGLKALTQNWSMFAKEKGIKLGDKCEFVLESEPVGLGRSSGGTCSVFAVNVTR